MGADMEKNRAGLLAEFTDLLNKYGSKSPKVKEFRDQHASDLPLTKLLDTAAAVQFQLKSGELKLSDDDKASAGSQSRKSARGWLIHLADWLDQYILRHQSYWVCNKIAQSNWWPEECPCSYCAKCRARMNAGS